MQSRSYEKMKPLKTGRQLFSWFCVGAVDKPLDEYQARSRKKIRSIFGVTFMAIFLAVNLPLLANRTSVNDIEAFFFGLSQLNISLHIASALITTFASGSKLASLECFSI